MTIRLIVTEGNDSMKIGENLHMDFCFFFSQKVKNDLGSESFRNMWTLWTIRARERERWKI
jgi:hypothetical protein